MTIDELCDQYERFAAIYYRQPGSKHPTGTLKNIRDALRVLRDTQDPTPAPGMLWQDRDRRIGDLPADLMTAKLLKAIQRAQADQGLARRTVNDRIAWIQRMFCWAGDPEQELLPEEICAKVRMVKPLRPGRSNAAEPAPKGPLDKERFRATMRIAMIENPKVQTMLGLLWLTGMRASECCRMRKSLINRDDATWTYWPDQHKTAHHGHQRPIALGPRARQILTAWWDQAAGDILFDGGRHVPNGRPMTRQALYNAVRRMNLAHEIPQWGLHQIRKAHATHIARKLSEDDARLMLGHSDAAVTRQHYIEVDLRRMKQIAEDLG